MPASAARKADCPVSPPARTSTCAKALHRACVVLGGAPELAARLQVPEPTLRAWMEGRGEPPEPVFLAAVEILLQL